MASFTTGKKASSRLSANKSVSVGSFKVQARASSSRTGKATTSFKTMDAPKSSFSDKSRKSSSFSTGEKSASSFKSLGAPTPKPVQNYDIKIKPVNKFADRVVETNIKAKVNEFKGTLIKPTKVTPTNGVNDKNKPVTPYRTISFKQTTQVKPVTDKVNINPVKININTNKPVLNTKIRPVTEIDVSGRVREFKGTLIKKPVPTTNPITTSVKKSKSSSGGSSGVWGGTGSLKSTGGLSSAEKQRKGITGSAYTQGSDKTPRTAKSYNTGKNERM